MEKLKLICLLVLWSSAPLVLDARTQKTEDAALARDLYLMIGTYSSVNNGKLPTSFEDLAKLDPIFNDRLDPSVEKQYRLIKNHDSIDGLPNWRLILINDQPIKLGYSEKSRIGRHLVYIDESGELKQIAETEEWFKKWIGDAIPGITFGEYIVEAETAKQPDEIAEFFEPLHESPTPESEVKEPVKVKPTEVAEETPEQSSQWWLWLVGALVVVGGLALVLRRKN